MPDREEVQEEDYKLAAVRGKMDEGDPPTHVSAIIACAVLMNSLG